MQRYDIDEMGARNPHSDGDYVLADDAEARIAELARERDEALDRAKTRELEFAHAREDMPELERELDTAREDARAARRERDDARAGVERLKEHVAEMTRDLHKLAGDANIAASSAAVVAMTRIQTLERERDEAKKRIETALRQLSVPNQCTGGLSDTIIIAAVERILLGK